MNEWALSLTRLMDIERSKRSRASTRWDKKLDALVQSWNVWQYQIVGQKPTPFTPPRKYFNWRDRFYFMRARWSYERRMFGWTRKLDNIRKEWADTGKQIKGGIIEMETQIKNERVKITDVRLMLEKQGHRCVLTGRELTPENCSIDHIMPLCKGGGHAKDNAQLVVMEVNRAKGMMTEDEFIQLCHDVVAEHKRKL